MRFFVILAYGSVIVFATNGDNLIALGTTARAMGGTGIAHFSAGSSATGNPALITQSKGGEFTFGGTYLSPFVKVSTSSTEGLNDLSMSSEAKKNIIPYAALTHNLNNGFAIGGSIYGIAGLGTNWNQEDGLVNDPSTGKVGLYGMNTNLTMLKISAPIAYNMDRLSIGIAPVLLFGTLRMSLDVPDRDSTTMAPLSTYQRLNNGTSTDTGIGYEIGLTYKIDDWGITFGAVYHSAISMRYKNQISAVSKQFGYGSENANFSTLDDELEQPAEIGFGLDWKHNDLSLTCDYRRINWAKAKGYSNFNWANQSIYALGIEYRFNELSLRAGYNYGKNPIRINYDETPVNSDVPVAYQNKHSDTINTFNHVMFPAITEQHYTAGMGYQFNRTTSADIALIYAKSPTVTVSAQSVGLGDVTVTNDQIAASAGLNIKF